MKYYEFTGKLIGIDDSEDLDNDRIRVSRSFSYGSKFDGDDFEMDVSLSELEQIFGMSARDIIYENGDLENCQYKPGHSCHICGTFLFGKDKLFGDSCAEVFSFMMEQMVEIGKVCDQNGCHNFNCCEQCVEKYLKKFIIEHDIH